MKTELPVAMPDQAEPWDSVRHMAPDPSLTLEQQLHWYSRACHILALNVSEGCRRRTAHAADKAVGR